MSQGERIPTEERPRRSGMVQNIAFLVIGLVIAGALFGGRGLFGSKEEPASPTPQPSATPTIITGAAVIQSIKSTAKLQTTRYTIETIVEAETPSEWGGLKSGERLLLIAHGSVDASVDLQQLSRRSVDVSDDGKTIALTLPPIQLERFLDEDKTRVYQRDGGKFIGLINGAPNPELETLARQTGQAQILGAACEDGILKQAESDARDSMEQLLGLMGFTSIEIDFEKADVSPCAGVPAATATP